MNRHGQTLVLFVILIPVILILLAVLVDTGYVIGKKVWLNEVTKQVIEDAINKDEEVVKALFEKNGVAIDTIEIIKSDGVLEIKNDVEVKSIFGSIVGIKKYNIKINVKGVLKDGRVVFED